MEEQSNEALWYVVHTYSGYENTVKATIEKTIETRHLEDLIHIVSIGMETTWIRSCSCRVSIVFSIVAFTVFSYPE